MLEALKPSQRFMKLGAGCSGPGNRNFRPDKVMARTAQPESLALFQPYPHRGSLGLCFDEQGL